MSCSGGKNLYVQHKKYFVIYNSCHPVSFCIAKSCYEKLWLISLSAHNDTAIVPKIQKFPVLIWQILPFHCYFGWLTWVFRLFPLLMRSGPESDEYSGYSSITVDPAVSCNRNRPRPMNFLSIQDFPKRMHIYIYTQISLIVLNNSESSQRYGWNIKSTWVRNEFTEES